MSDLDEFRAHARQMASATHRPECFTRLKPWLKARPAAGCGGCVTSADRVLWRRLADEADAYAARTADTPLL